MSKKIDLFILNKAKKQLKIIENNKKSWKSEFAREQDIWETIAEELNSCQTEEDEQFWGLVMDLYHKKYSDAQPY